MKSTIKINHSRVVRVLFAAAIIGIISSLYVQENLAGAAGPVRGAGNYKSAPPTPPPPGPVD